MSTQDLIQQAQDRKYTEFDIKAKEMLAAKVAEKMGEKGYVDRLTVAKNEPAAQEAPATFDESEKSDEYKKVYAAELAKFDVKSPADLSDEDKKKFFDAVDAAYDAEDEEPEAGDK